MGDIVKRDQNMDESLAAGNPNAADEKLEALLQQLDDEISIHSYGLSSEPPARDSLSERLGRMRTIRAPFLSFNTWWGRWLAGVLNLVAFPWARKQALFNTETMAALEELNARARESTQTAAAIARVEARLNRLEYECRQIIALQRDQVVRQRDILLGLQKDRDAETSQTSTGSAT